MQEREGSFVWWSAKLDLSRGSFSIDCGGGGGGGGGAAKKGGLHQLTEEPVSREKGLPYIVTVNRREMAGIHSLEREFPTLFPKRTIRVKNVLKGSRDEPWKQCVL